MVVYEIELDGQVGAGGVWQGQRCRDKRVFDGDCPGYGEADCAPDASIASADGGDPVPAGRSMVGGIVCAETSTVLAGALEGLLVDAPRRGILFDAHGKGVGTAWKQLARHVKAAAHEAALNAAKLLAIEKDFSLPVDAVEVEPCNLLRAYSWRGELRPIPEVGVEEGIGDIELVFSEVGVGYSAHVQIRRKYSARHGRHKPSGILDRK